MKKKKPYYKRWWFIVIIVILVIVLYNSLSLFLLDYKVNKCKATQWECISYCGLNEGMEKYDCQQDCIIDGTNCIYGEEIIPKKTTTNPPDDPPQCKVNVFNCDDFSSQGEAQAVFEECGGLSNDIHHLDGDEDGIACESLP
jgi:hypothetical protein